MMGNSYLALQDALHACSASTTRHSLQEITDSNPKIRNFPRTWSKTKNLSEKINRRKDELLRLGERSHQAPKLGPPRTPPRRISPPPPPRSIRRRLRQAHRSPRRNRGRPRSSRWRRIYSMLEPWRSSGAYFRRRRWRRQRGISGGRDSQSIGLSRRMRRKGIGKGDRGGGN